MQLAIGTLNERQRLGVLLAKFEHLSYEEIGEVMEMTPQAVKSLLARARENLRGCSSHTWSRGQQVEGNNA